MKKHILGVALFSLIVASFALIYAFFFSPSIPPKEAVKPPVSRTETRAEKPTSCYPKRMKGLNYTIESASYFEEHHKLVTKVNLYWNGNGEAPKKISLQPRMFQANNNEIQLPLKYQTIVNPFESGNSTTVSCESQFVFDGTGDSSTDLNPVNLYLAFDLLDAPNGNNLTSEKPNLAEAFHILYVYPESSVIKLKNKTFKGTSVPR